MSSRQARRKDGLLSLQCARCHARWLISLSPPLAQPIRSSLIAMATPSAIPTPLPVPHPECTSLRNAWIGELEQSADWIECENRPWANAQNKKAAGCIGNDFVFYQPKVHMRFWWNQKTLQLAGAVHFDHNAEGPPSKEPSA